MPDYMAVVRRRAGDSSSRIMFTAQDLRHALLEMARGADVKDTDELSEFELNEIVSREGKGSYKCVAVKELDSKKMHCRVNSSLPVVITQQEDKYKERAYQSYDIIRA